MKTTLRLLILLAILIVTSTQAQDRLLAELAAKNHQVFQLVGGEFEGEGWEYIKEKIAESRNVLIGEDHFTNEIPLFVQAVAKVDSFDNFYIEVDPYSTKIIERSLKEYSKAERETFNEEYGDLFSFYSLKPEYDLLKELSDTGLNILGSDQVVAYADRLIFQDLKSRSFSEEAKVIYSRVIDSSKFQLKRFYEETNNPMSMYFMSEDFKNDLNELKELDLSDEEAQIIKDMERSVQIYQEQSHRKRVRLILNQLMKDYPLWKDAKNLFKYGANHMARGESFLTTYDIGNLVANISESNYQESFHIMIIGESGQLGSIFKNFPPNPIDKENSLYLNHLKPFFEITEGSNWHVFNLVPLRKMLDRGRLNIDNRSLERTIKGFDVLVIIPEVTPAKHLN